MASPTDICNMALSRCGIKRRIADIGEKSEEGRICNLHYDICLLSLLGASEWPFATRRAELALIETLTGMEWAYRYELPNDCAGAQYIEASVRAAAPDQRIPWKIEAHATDQLVSLVTDHPEPVLVYTSSAIPSGLYPPDFVKALSAALAVEIAVPLGGKIELVEPLMKIADRLAAVAIAGSRAESHPDIPPDTETVRSRL